jgi:hypothetical protein
MSNVRRTYVTTAIAYVNDDPHLGYALECVQADVLGPSSSPARRRRPAAERHRRQRAQERRCGAGGRAAGGTVRRAEGRPLRGAAHAAALSNDDFIRTSTDPRHRPGVERLWRACAQAGDLYQRDYEGLYCSDCEAFLAPADLRDGRCPEHAEAPAPVVERNWFSCLSRYGTDALRWCETCRPTATSTFARRCSSRAPTSWRTGSATSSTARSRSSTATARARPARRAAKTPQIWRWAARGFRRRSTTRSAPSTCGRRRRRSGRSWRRPTASSRPRGRGTSPAPRAHATPRLASASTPSSRRCWTPAGSSRASSSRSLPDAAGRIARAIDDLDVRQGRSLSRKFDVPAGHEAARGPASGS